MTGEQVSFHRASLNRPISEIRSGLASAGDQVGFRRSTGNRPIAFDASNLTSIRPTSIANCSIWLDASQTSFNDNDAVGTWTDIAFASTFTQGTAGNKPTFKANAINGRPAVYFVTNDYLTSAITTASALPASASSVFAVVKVNSFPTSNSNSYDNGGIFSEAGGFMGMFLGGTSTGARFYNFDGSVDQFNIAISLNTPYVIHRRHDGTTMYGSVNGGTETTTASGARTNASTFQMGTNYAAAAFIDAYIGEFIAYSVALSSRDVKTVINSLKTKYGIP